MPLVAVAVAAPAFASSPGDLSPGALAGSCRCIGNGDFYHLNISFTNNTGISFTVNGTSLTSSTNGTTTFVGPQSQVVPAGSTVVLTFRFPRSSNQSKIQVTFKYTVTNGLRHLGGAGALRRRGELPQLCGQRLPLKRTVTDPPTPRPARRTARHPPDRCR